MPRDPRSCARNRTCNGCSTAELRLAHLCFEQQVDRGSVADVSHWDHVFHHQLAVCSGNEVLACLHQNANETLATQRRSLLALPGVAARSLREHARILDAIERRDAEGAVAASRPHRE